MTDSNLDERLEELSIWIEANRDVSPRDWEDEIWPLIRDRFKQAFQDEGYVKIPQGQVGRLDGVEIMSINGKRVMTGQEWYDRYIKELEKLAVTHSDNAMLTFNNTVATCDIAAKKASGLNE